MRRTMNTNNYTLAQISRSKMDLAKVLNTLENARGDSDSLDFKAADLGLYGSQLGALVGYHIIEVVGKETYWFPLNDDTMKKASVNIYRFDTDVSNLLNSVRDFKAKEITKKIKNYKKMIKKLQIKLNNL